MGSAIPGERIRLLAYLGSARIIVQVDVAYGHAITPGTERRFYPSLLGYGPFLLNCYPRETVVAEKLATAVEFGRDNTRLRDYFDLWYVTSRYVFQPLLLVRAIYETFGRRDAWTLLQDPGGHWLTAFNAEMVTPSKRRLWQNWLAEHAPSVPVPTFERVVEEVADFALPLLHAARKLDEMGYSTDQVRPPSSSQMSATHGGQEVVRLTSASTTVPPSRSSK